MLVAKCKTCRVSFGTYPSTVTPPEECSMCEGVRKPEAAWSKALRKKYLARDKYRLEEKAERE